MFHAFLERWWREILIALLAAVLLELGINIVMRQTLWHRVAALEQRVEQLEQMHSSH